MTAFGILFLIAGVVAVIPFVVAVGDGCTELVFRVRRALPSRGTHAQLYCRDVRRGRT